MNFTKGHNSAHDGKASLPNLPQDLRRGGLWYWVLTGGHVTELSATTSCP